MDDLWYMAAIATSIKLLLLPSYHSTDFEVHRNWLAITHSLPLNQWYTDETSEWTLDYPPFFAWFEWLLSIVAARVDPRIVDLKDGLNYAAPACIFFHRATVIAADGLLYYALWRFCKGMRTEKKRLVYAAAVFSPGLFMVDHIHFQYNGFLLGILVLSIAALKEGKDVLGGLIFAALVCFKHLFAVAGPVYFVYLLRHYCTGPARVRRFFSLASAVLAVVLLAFAPFIYYQQLPQVLHRLFPFGRGLCHAYWAPNVWALYNTADKALSQLFRVLGIPVRVSSAAYTGGLVGDLAPHAILPEVTPSLTLALVLIFMLPCLYRIWREPRQSRVVHYIAYAFMCGFMFGWHVHEKASLHFVVPLGLIAVDTKENAADYLFLSTVCHYSLFPLLFGAQEYPIKVVMLVLQFGLLCTCFRDYFAAFDNRKGQSRSDDQFLGKPDTAFLLGIIFVELYAQFLHQVLFQGRLPFVPLMLVSGYCSLGLFHVWGRSLCGWFRSKNSSKID